MQLTIQEYPADSLEFRFRTGPVWQPCKNSLPAREAWKYVKPMQDLLIESGGIGLSANQVGLNIPLFVLRFKDRVQPVYRPRIINLSGELVKAVEGCLSFPGAFLPIYRYPKITVDFIAFPNNKRLKMSLWGLMARAFQHEVDHLNGKTLFHHYVSSVDTVVTEEAPKSVLILD